MCIRDSVSSECSVVGPITNQSRQKLTACSQSNKLRTTGSVISIRHCSKSVAGDGIRCFSWFVVLDRLVAGLLMHNQVFLHRRLAGEIGCTVFANSFSQKYFPTTDNRGRRGWQWNHVVGPDETEPFSGIGIRICPRLSTCLLAQFLSWRSSTLQLHMPAWQALVPSWLADVSIESNPPSPLSAFVRIWTTPNTNYTKKQTKHRFGRLLRPPAWKRSGTILVEREEMDKRRK